MKSTVNDLDITPLLRFLFQRNILFSNLFFLFFHFLPPFFLLPSLNARFHQSAYLSSTSSNSFLTFINILSRTCHPTCIVPSPYTSLVIPSSCTCLLLSPIVLLQPLFFKLFNQLFCILQVLSSFPSISFHHKSHPPYQIFLYSSYFFLVQYFFYLLFFNSLYLY